MRTIYTRRFFFIVMVGTVIFTPTTVFAMNDPIPVLSTLNVYLSSSRTLGLGTPICTGVSLTSADECTGTLNQGSTYRFEANIATTIADYAPTDHGFDNAVAAGDVLGTILVGDLLVGCVESNNNNNTGDPAINGTSADGGGYSGGTACTMDPTTGGTVYWIITIDTDSVVGQTDADFSVTDGEFADTSTLVTFNVAAAAKPASLTQHAYKWFANTDTVAVGGSSGHNAPTVAPVQNTPFRLRTLLYNEGGDLSAGGETLDLQVALSDGSTCDGDETYIDVSSASGDIRYYTGNSATDGDTIAANVFDPRATSAAVTVINQDYEDSNTFTNSALGIAENEAGLWDFALVDFSAPPHSTYCLRAVLNSGDTPLSTYDVYPEIITAQKISVRLRGAIRLRIVRLR